MAAVQLTPGEPKSFNSGDVLYMNDGAVLLVNTPTTATACTLTPTVSLNGASFRTRKYDIDGTSYPRAAFSGGEELVFYVGKRTMVKVTASLTGMIAMSV